MISDKTLQEELIQLSDELEKQTIQLRREIHQCPELSFQGRYAGAGADWNPL